VRRDVTIPYDLGPMPPGITNRLPRAGSPVVCPHCLDGGHVCENHPDYPWEERVEGHDGEACGGAGMPCGYCCSPIPEDGSTSIVMAFTPDWKRPRTDRDAGCR
jgi:hypothetical protein